MKTIQLSRGLSTKVDDEDFVWLTDGTSQRGSPRKWSAVLSRHGMFYACSRLGKMARLIVKAGPGEFVDHINGDTLDNRRCNLRIVKKVHNEMNRRKRKGCRSLYKGVAWCINERSGKPLSRPWRAYIGGICTGGRIHLGKFESEREAALAYNEAAVKYFGEYAKLNVIEVVHD